MLVSALLAQRIEYCLRPHCTHLLPKHQLLQMRSVALHRFFNFGAEELRRDNVELLALLTVDAQELLRRIIIVLDLLLRAHRTNNYIAMAPFFAVVSLLRRQRKSRLTLLEERLKANPIKQVTLLQAPAKELFTICCLLAFIWFLDCFYASLSAECCTTSLRKTISLLQWVFLLAVAWIGYHLRVRWVSAVAGKLTVKDYSLPGGKMVNEHLVGSLTLHREGIDRFTHCDYKYVIRADKEKDILQRDSVFQGRKSLLQLCAVLQIPYLKKIH